MVIKGVSFCLWSAEDILRRSVVEVTQTSIYQKNLPRERGLADHRMGTVDRTIHCGTCRQDVEKCNGHPAHMVLPIPCYSAFFLTQTIKVLRSVCFFCSRLLIATHAVDPETGKRKKTKLAAAIQQYEGIQRFHIVTKLARNQPKCPHCDAMQPTYNKRVMQKVFGIDLEWSEEAQKQWNTEPDPDDDEAVEMSEEKKQQLLAEKQMAMKPFTSVDAYNILKHMTAEDIRLIGMDPDHMHPRNFMITVLEVPPPVIRPSVVASEGSRSKGQNDLTRKLLEIMKQCHALQNVLREFPGVFEKPEPLPTKVYWAVVELQYHVVTYMNNPIRGMKPAAARSGAPTKGFQQRIKGKGGRIRGNLGGKRVDFSSRTVVSPDPNLDIDEVGVPERIALILTIEEKVTPFNIHLLQQRVTVGAKNIRGAHTVINDKGKMDYLQFTSKVEDRQRIRLEYGWTVERYLQDGDYVLFNRQPSLHKKSLMAHRVRVMKGDTFRLNLSVTTPYNADFDGDEMNLHAINNIEARAELRELLAITRQTLNAQTNKPTFGLVQDALTGSYAMTRKDTFLTRQQVMNLMTAVPKTMAEYNAQYHLPLPAVLKPVPLWTGKQIYSLLFPRNVNLVKTVRNGPDPYDPLDHAERCVCIRGGQLLSGALCKQTVGSTTGGVVHIIAKDCSMEKACLFLSDAQRMVNLWIQNYGFSAGISDCVAGPDVEQGVRDIITHAYDRIAYINRQMKEGVVQKDEIEEPVTNILREVITKTGKLSQTKMSDLNRIFAMATAGSKGSPVNLAQILATVGQQTVDGQRLHTKNSGKRPVTLVTRTLSCYDVGDEHPETHGFCPNSYVSGLEPEEFFMCAQGGREGLVDTAVKTSVTGYIQRRLLKAMEAAQMQFDQSVRNAEGYIIDFLYGGDGMDAQFLEPFNVPLIGMSDAEVRSSCGMEWLDPMLECMDENWRAAVDAYLATALRMRDEARAAKRNQWSGEIDASVLLPVHVPRMLDNMWQAGTKGITMLTPTLLYQVLTAAVHKLSRRGGTLFMRVALWALMSPKRLCVEHQSRYWTLEMVMDVLDTCEARFTRSLADSGEMVGALSSESIGEPSTQLTLNTFHLSGVGNKNVSMGVPRLRELIDVTKKMKTPSLTVTLRPQFMGNKEAAERLAQTMIYTTLATLVQDPKTVWEPNFNTTTVPEDAPLLRDASMFREPAHLSTASRWVIRLVLNRALVMARGLRPVDVANVVREYVNGAADVIYSPTNTDVWIIRITLYKIREMATQASTDEHEQVEIEKLLTQKEMKALLHSVCIGGISGISNATVREVQRVGVDSATGELVRKKEWVIDTDGTALEQVWSLDAVDWTRTVSNDLHEIYETMGIEAAAQVLFQEIKTVLSFDGSYVNDRHITMVVRTMCLRGYLMPMSRHGINRVDTGVLMKISFEESMEMMMNAAVFNESDSLKGITENILVGARAPMGTGSVKMVMDPDYQRLMHTVVYGKKREITRRQRVFRSMITEWNMNSLDRQDDLDLLDRPPSPPASPPWRAAPVEEAEAARVVDSTIFTPVYLPPLPPLDDALLVEPSAKKYRPSSPDLEQDHKNHEDAPQRDTSGTRVTADVTHYRPSSPELSDMPVGRQVASFIPLASDSTLAMPPPELFASAMEEEEREHKKSANMALMPVEPATEQLSSEALLTSMNPEELSKMLNDLAAYLPATQ